MHGHRVDRLTLQPVDTHVWDARFRILGDHQPERDHTAGVARPGTDQGDVVEIHLVAAKHLLAAGGREISIRPGLDQIPEHACELLRFL